MRSMVQIGIVVLVKTFLHMLAMNLRIIYSSIKDN